MTSDPNPTPPPPDTHPTLSPAPDPQPGTRAGLHEPDRLWPWVFTQHQVWVDVNGNEHEIELMPLVYIRNGTLVSLNAFDEDADQVLDTLLVVRAEEDEDHYADRPPPGPLHPTTEQGLSTLAWIDKRERRE